MDLTSLIFHIGLVVTISLHRIITHQQHMADYTETKQIAFIIIRLLMLPTVLDHLGSHITHRTTSFIVLDVHLLVQHQRQTEVYYARTKCCSINQDVLGLQIPMNYLSVMDVSDPLHDHLQQWHNYSRISHLLLLPKVHQILTRKILQNHHKVMFLLVELLEFVDVLTFDHPEDASLFQDQVFSGSFILVFFIDDFGSVVLASLNTFNFHNLTQSRSTTEKLPLPIDSISSYRYLQFN